MLLSPVLWLYLLSPCLLLYAPVSWLMLLSPDPPSRSCLLSTGSAFCFMLLSPDPASRSCLLSTVLYWLFLLPPCFLLPAPVSCILPHAHVCCLFLLSPCLLSHAPVSWSCLMLLSSVYWLFLLPPMLPASCPACLLSLASCSRLLSTVSSSRPHASYIMFLSQDPSTRSCLLILCSCLLSPGAATFFVLWLSLIWLSCLLILLHAPLSSLLHLPPAFSLIAPTTWFCQRVLSPAFYLITPSTWSCQRVLSLPPVMSPASHPKVLSTCSTSRVSGILVLPPVHVVSPQSTYIDRDETGWLYLPTQLERTLQLCTWL